MISCTQTEKIISPSQIEDNDNNSPGLGCYFPKEINHLWKNRGFAEQSGKAEEESDDGHFWDDEE